MDGFFAGETSQGRQAAGEKLRLAHEHAKRVADTWVRKGGKLRRKTQTNLVWLDLENAGISPEQFVEIGQTFGIKFGGSRIVLHYQISEEALRRLSLAFDMACSGK